MNRTAIFLPMALALLAATALPAMAQNAPGKAFEQPVNMAPAVTRHKGEFGGQKLRYTATVESLPVRLASGESANVGSFTYTRDGVDAAKRPVMFLFNGGPITPSLYVHVGGIGPKRVAFPDDVKAPPSTFRLVDNLHSPLDVVDLVFVDPASTGFSRVDHGTKPADFFSNRQDAAQFVAFIRAWQKRHGREKSPVHLFGESYGTHRVAEIAAQVAADPDPIPLAGIFAYGQAINVVEWSQRPANIISYVASLPTIAATGWFHGKVDRKGRSVEQFIAEASAWGEGPYLTALYQGAALPEAARREIAGKLEGYSGIPADWYLAHDLRITKEQYRVELLKADRRILGQLDARYTAPIADAGGAQDPSGVIVEAVQSHFRTYLQRDLGVQNVDAYLTGSPVGGMRAWDWGGTGAGPFADWPYHRGLVEWMGKNPKARLVVGNGYFDTLTTLGGAELLVNQAGFDRDRVSLRYYDGGHMGYSVDAVAKQIGDDIRALVRAD
ncbi:peptidase S10 [Sandaracinobacter sp. RS1-74]|uniref:S10 family peptidase n=1 Tax=Sandaracinobacteroides sayramensis TaxID=2913411 RepID=UPI001EDC46F7|nr:peptidase S10 [Sandaracinobacteroides sayramensis]MCG2842080.1 peptidase S10 [Sandaracinobacteroides sayramensis]